jgi:transcriptional regulator with XRE-family HTH domain
MKRCIVAPRMHLFLNRVWQPLMTPFSDYLFQLRRNRGLRQRELADILGVEQTYLSALEAARKDPPSPEQVARFAMALELTEEEHADLLYAAQISKRKLELPEDTNRAEYQLVHELVNSLGGLSDDQISVIRTVLRMRFDRRTPLRLEENAM